MAFLKDLKVRKISFVGRPANKRQFLLLKSEDIEDADVKEQQLKQTRKGEMKMNDVVKQKVVELFKTEQDSEKVLTLIKADKDLTLSEEELHEVENSLSLIAELAVVEEITEPELESMTKENEAETVPMEPAIPESKLAKADPEIQALIKAMQENTQAMATRLDKQDVEIQIQKDQNQLAEITKWIVRECPFLAGDVEQYADEILALEKVNPATAKTFKETLRRTASVLEGSNVFDEIGGGGDGNSQELSLGADYLSEVQKRVDDVQKSGKKANEVDIIRDTVKRNGRKTYMAYRNQHIRRAKLNGLHLDR